VEAMGYHKRQPYAVLVAVLFLPMEACEDASSSRASSFGQWVEYLWTLGGREDPHDEFDRFEKVDVGLYDPASAEIGFFDVGEIPPPRSGAPPSATLQSLDDFVAEVTRIYDERNELDFRWADE